MNTAFDIGARLKSLAGGGGALTAGGTGDNTAQNGAWLDRSKYLSCKMVVFYKATLAQGATLSLAALLQDADSNAGAGGATFGNSKANAVVATGGTGGSTETGTVEIDFSLQRARQFVRPVVTPDLSAANTDTAVVSAVLVFGSAVNNPITGSALPPAL